jgi:hypothetical protein
MKKVDFKYYYLLIYKSKQLNKEAYYENDSNGLSGKR